MFNKISFLLLLFAFVLVGCSTEKENITNTANNSGKIALKFDKVNAPSSVVIITATLKREGFQEISGQLNIKSDSSAELLLSEIQEGKWHLIVEAQDSLGKIIYAGETDVTIVADYITSVNLTLLPTNSGVGSIYIYVTWGQISDLNKWEDYNQNPIIQRQQSPLFPNEIALSKIIYENGLYKMYYQNVFNTAKALIGYSESSNGYTWKFPFTSSVSPTDSSNYGWDSYTRGIGPVIKVGERYFLYYYGFENQYSLWQIGLATSFDGIHFTKRSEPVLKATDTERLVVASDILKVDNKYFLYYTFGDASSRNYVKGISLAISNDGINWERYSQNPIIIPTQVWEGGGVGHPSVIYDNGEFKMIYMEASGAGFGLATSKDGKNWQKGVKNPVFTSKDTYQNWSQGVYYPFMRKIDNKYKLFYTGTNYSGELCIGIAEKTSW